MTGGSVVVPQSSTFGHIWNFSVFCHHSVGRTCKKLMRQHFVTGVLYSQMFWTTAIRSNVVASLEQKMLSKVEFRVLAGRLVSVVTGLVLGSVVGSRYISNT